MENAENLFKKLVYTGVGFISLTADKVKKAVDELISENKISESEGKKIVDDFFKETESKKTEYEGKLKDLVQKVSEKMKFVKSDEIEKLSKRIEELEKALADKMK